MSTWHDHCYAVILAGGQGTRLWPLSRTSRPKQLLPLVGAESLLVQTAARLRPLMPVDRLYIVSGQEYIPAIQSQLPDLPATNLLAEPQPRSTAAAVGLATAVIASRDTDAVIVTLAADHVIEQPEEFRRVLQVALQAAQQGDHLLTIGIRPTRPVTGYGYIHSQRVAFTIAGREVYAVERFVEKPDAATARRYLASGEYYWNASYFGFHCRTLLAAVWTYLPKLAEGLEHIQQAWGTDRQTDVLKAVYERLESVPIEYGIFERAPNVLMVPGDFGWSDVGDWAAIQDLTAPTTGTNVVVGEGKGDYIGLDTERCLIHTSGRLIATIGIEDLVIVDAGDALLICRRDRTQEVRRIVDLLQQERREA